MRRSARVILEKFNWCGRIIDGTGVQRDPKRHSSLKDISRPQLGDELQQFVCAANWMRAAIPQLKTTVSSLDALLETVYALENKRTKHAVEKISLKEVGWNESHDLAFQNCIEALSNAV